MPEDVTPIHVDTKEAARILGVSPVTVKRLIARGDLVSRKFGRRRLVDVDSLIAYGKGLPADGAA